MTGGTPTDKTARSGGPRVARLLSALAIAALLALPATALAAKGGGGTSPSVAVATVVSRSTGGTGSIHVSGAHFTPSAGGQQVILWVAYPDDYCSADFTVCHGFYSYPWVDADGSFSLTYDNVLMQSGTGSVSASQWNVKRGSWVQVANVSYTAP
jgi:hypothetical protein